MSDLLRGLLSLPWVDEAYVENGEYCVALASDWFFAFSTGDDRKLGYGFGRFCQLDDALTACRRANVYYGAPFYRLENVDGRLRAVANRVYGGVPVSLAVDLGWGARTRLGVVGGEAELFDGRYRPLPSFNKLRFWEHSDYGAWAVFDSWRGAWMAASENRRRDYAVSLLEWAVQRFHYLDHVGDDYAATGSVWVGLAGPYRFPNIEGGRTVVDECTALCFSGASDRDTRYVLRRYGVRRAVKVAGWSVLRHFGAGNAAGLISTGYTFTGLGEWTA